MCLFCHGAEGAGGGGGMAYSRSWIVNPNVIFGAPLQSDSDAGFGAESDSLLFWLSRLFLIADLSLSSTPLPPPADRLYLFPIVPPPPLAD